MAEHCPYKAEVVGSRPSSSKMKRKEKKLYNKDGEVIGFSSRVRLIDKYWHRIKMKFKKEHDRWCQCYWCLKERFSTDITCPKCKKRKLRSSGYHTSYVNKPHESGYILHCKCGYKSKKNSY